MGAVESDSVKSARKAKDKLHKACERASETREQTLHGQEQNRMCMATMRESRDGVRFLINTQVPAAPRVWHFSAFHLNGSSSYQHRKPATEISTNSSVVSLLALSQESFRATLFHTQVNCAKLEG